ncbi:tail fiber domain-containing protein [Frigidibacter sp. ROC022]|uniref:tail fiber domain-containing protein n=1 Tax=Frigidibacter sp. ROC022 TaxID=2971796 RepID=UPI00215AEFCD|nr:tail fiber domain-containing protein [Frigidibacter sp. ROC022]MCR8724170.1 tail fiber domain-containing protein [Frigidibacter sp. ROC022]
MKTRLAFTLAAAMTVGQSVQAGGMAPAIVEPTVVIEDTSSSSASGLIVPLMLLLLVAAAASSSDSGSGGTVSISDARLKTDIERVSTAANGLPVYQFRYRGHPEIYQGVMAQDVLQRFPDAVITLPSGYMAVNYDRLGLRMERID